MTEAVKARHIQVLVLTVVLIAVAGIAGAQTVLKVGGVYCVSQVAIEEHLKATAEANTDRVRDILSVRKICDYTQAPINVTVLQAPATAKWSRVRITNPDGPWRKGSKVTLPKDLIVYVRKNSLQ